MRSTQYRHDIDPYDGTPADVRVYLTNSIDGAAREHMQAVPGLRITSDETEATAHVVRSEKNMMRMRWHHSLICVSWCAPEWRRMTSSTLRSP